VLVTFEQPDSIDRHDVGMLLQIFVPAALLFHLPQGDCVVDAVLCVQHYVLIWGLLLLQNFDGSENLGNRLFVGSQVREYLIAVLGLF
jgi:hypothetical protein